MSTRQPRFDQYGHEYGLDYRQPAQGPYSHAAAYTQTDQSSDPYHSDARTQYGPYDPRFGYEQPNSSQHKGGIPAQPPTPSSAGSPHYTYAQQRNPSASSYQSSHQSMQAITNQMSQMQTRVDMHGSNAPSYDYYPPSTAQQYATTNQYYGSSSDRPTQHRQRVDQPLPYQQYSHAPIQSQGVTTSRQHDVFQYDRPSYTSSSQWEEPTQSTTAYAVAASATNSSQSYPPERREPLDRPVSSSASGIISLYTDDSYTPLLDQNPTFASFSPDSYASTPPTSTGAARSDVASSDRMRQPSQRARRPLPITPAAKRSEQLPPHSPDALAASIVATGSAVSAPVSSPNRADGSASHAQQGYFIQISPQPAAWSPPVTPTAAQHGTTPSTSSNSYTGPSWSPSPSSQGTPNSSFGKRPLPPPATSLDRSFSPPPRDAASSSPLSAFRSPSYTQPNPRSARPCGQNRSESEQRPDAAYGRAYRTASASQSHTVDSSYDPDVSYEASSSVRDALRQRTRSEASELSNRPSRAYRQPLPPIPGATPAANQTDSHANSANPPAVEQDAALVHGRTRMPSQGSLQHQPSYSQMQQPSKRPQAQQRSTSYRDDEKRDLGQKYSHERFDSLAWEPVNSPTSKLAAEPTHARNARASRIEAPEWSLLSTVALLLRANVPRGVQIKGSIDYPNSFTGKDVVSTLQELLLSDQVGSRHNLVAAGDPNTIRQVALSLAKSLKSQLFFHEVDWGENELTDDVDEVYTFLEDSLADPSSAAEDPDDWAAALNHSSAFDSSLPLSIGGAAGGLDNGGQRRKAAHMNDLDELPNGVFTPLTQCYSPLCTPGRLSACYSPSCPNSASSPLRLTVTDTESKGAKVGGLVDNGLSSDQTQKKAWAEIVPPEVLKTIPQAEIARQNAILETIQKEEEFLADLELLDTLFVQGLQKPSDAGDPPPLPIGSERDDFIREVFGNHCELAMHIRALVERLHIRQREEAPIIQTMGDLFLSAALDWGDVYIAYLVNYPLAISRVKREISINPRFKAFVEACRRHPAAHKHPLENFLFRPPARLQRYHLHLESILKKTEEGNHDRDSLQNAIDIINDQCKTAQAGVESAELKVKIREYAYNLSAKRNKNAIDMDLLNPERQLIRQGRVLRKPDAFDFDWTELLAILFDNYFIVCKQKRIDQGPDDDVSNVASLTSSAGARFVLAKRPIPVEMLEISGLTESSISRSIGLSNFHISREREARDFWPFTVSHLGRKIEPIALYAPSKAARDQWKAKLDEAIGLRMAVQDSNKVFDQHVLSDDIFAIPSALSLEPEKPVPGVDPSVFHGRVTCAVPFVTADGRRLVAVGCADGVWIGLRNDPKSLRKVLHLKYVTQCAVLESFGIFVVLADKVLISYSLEALVPTTSSSASTLRPPQKLSGNRDVLFFNVGVLKDRTLLIYMKKKASESVFRALEPVLNAPRGSEGKSGSGFFGKFGKDSKNSDWFRIYKTFFIPSEAYSIQFLKSKLCIICAKGFEIMNLDSLLPGTIPDFVHANREDVRVQQLAKRVETAKPLGMYKTSDGDFLLCYDAFACYVDRLGEPTRLEQIIEWEGFPKQVAFSGNYVLAFDSRFVEVRDALTGRLVQIMRGVDLHYISGNSTVASSPSESAQLTALDAEANPVIFSRRERVAGRIPFDFQRVVELSPVGTPNSYAYLPPFQRTATIMSNGSSSSSRPSGRPAVVSSGNWI
ncbi:related to ROM2 - GDP/GTP exchange factor for Rho1p [Melanopsichium pennsylvanicum]|uniref:Related to ROM2 - GDP/GTP exchange factor for Rho1p n=2 Tax=Melanopsichium pennsylvanicum TaxID=63383 RepID=A0AAJ4XHK2_9BASI|nr:related to ROM2-GDP/GTP exchange factor for Rho1p [Melanopsichium pennsylvanicum 4]SNX82432.1 related to ROM2 - GDP/GTP exchange factor for Rho1p [Melanopsichium pennsylvanicum]